MIKYILSITGLLLLTHRYSLPISWTLQGKLTLQANIELCGDGIDNDNDGSIDEACLPFECDGTLYQSASSGPNFLLYEVDVNPISFNPIANISSNSNVNNFNSLAYNPVDNLMYGMGTNDARLFRIDAAGSVEYLGDVAGLTAFKNGGTFDNQGNYYVFGDNTLRRIDINNLTYVTVGSPGAYGSADIVFNPVDNMIYGWSGNPKLLFKIDPNTGTQTKIPGNAPLAINSFGWTGAMYFNAQGEILGYQNTNMIKIDPQTGIAVSIGTGPSKSGNDGCSCSFGVEMTKSVSGNYEAGDTITYTFEFYNQSFSDISGNLRFEDILTDGINWVSNPYNIQNLQLSGNTNTTGSNIADFIVSLLPRGTSSFSIDARIPCDFSNSSYSNQAKLFNLPAPLKDSILSDNPNTPTITDPTDFQLNSVPLQIESIVEHIICEQNVGSITLNVNGGAAPLSYIWDNGSSGNAITGLDAGTYQVSIIGATGCQVVKTEVVETENVELITEIDKNNVSCNGLNDGAIEIVNTTGGYPSYEYALNGANFSSLTRFDNIAAGNYQLLSRDQYGCIGINNFSIAEPLFKLQIEGPADTTVILGQLIDGTIFQNTISNVNYTWLPDIGLSCSSCQGPTITATTSTVYTIIGEDIQGCYDTTYLEVEVREQSSVYIPNAFSPNGDGNNDVLMVYGGNDIVQIKSMRIFDRWGELVFERTNYAPNSYIHGWNGSFNGKALNTGVYVYVAEIELINGKVVLSKGDLSLIR